MHVWSKILEGAVKDLARQNKVEQADVKGHGVVKIRTKKEDFFGEVDEKNELCNSNRSKEARRLAKQMRRIEAIKELNRILAKEEGGDGTHASALRQELANAVKAFHRNADTRNQKEHEVVRFLEQDDISQAKTHFAHAKFAKEFDKVIQRCEEEEKEGEEAMTTFSN